MTANTVDAQPQTAEADVTGTPPAAAQTEPAEQVEPAKPRRGRPKGTGARTTRTVELVLTVSGTADGDWQAELRHGNTWVTRGLPVSAASVSRAAKELHEDLAGPIDEVIDTARSQHQARIAALEAELQQARKALAELAE